MPKVSDAPAKIRPYVFHGLDLSIGSKEAIGECPFCGTAKKFYVSVETGQWSCKVCGTGTSKGGGNVYTFLRLLHEHSVNAKVDLEDLRVHRRLMSEATLRKWSCCRSFLTREWIVPGYGQDGKIHQLYRYIKDIASGKWRLLATPELGHCLYGINLYNPKKPDVWLCEGPWDAMSLYEMMRTTKLDDNDNLTLTSNELSSLYAQCNILAVPSCNTFSEQWSYFLRNKIVHLMFDSDHPKKNPRTEQLIPSAGHEGMKRVAGILGRVEQPPKEIHFVSWGSSGYDPSRPSGWDVRDVLTLSPKGGGVVWPAKDRIARLSVLLDRIYPIPADWIGGRTSEARASGGVEVDCLPCEDWQSLVTSWRKAMRWIDGLDRALSVCLAVILSTKVLGDPLWLKLVAPPGAGKSTICEALSVNKKYIYPKSTIRGFHSGFRAGGDEDNALIDQVKGKTLVTKDGDTLLQSPNLGQILAEARDVYDSTSRSHYRTGAGKDYTGIRMTWILAGTASLRKLDDSELGERFLDCVIMDKIDPDLEDEILFRAAHRAERNMSFMSDGKMETQHDADLVQAMQLTGGYITYLRENAQQLLDKVRMPQSALHTCMRLGIFVSYMRARPSARQDESSERELGSRLVIQLVRLAKCLAVVLNRPTVDEEVMRRVRTVALDTARGRVLDLAAYLFKNHKKGVDAAAIPIAMNYKKDKCYDLLAFLRKIEAVEIFFLSQTTGYKSPPRWRLSVRLYGLYDEIIGAGDRANAEATNA